jgi:hypothetical protein
MKPDSILVEPGHIVEARQDLDHRGFPQAMADLADREPALAAYISESMASLAGKLALSGAPTPIVQGLYNEALAVLLSSVEAQRRGHFDLWKGTIVGTRIESLFKPKAKKASKPRRRKGKDDKTS